MHDSRIKAEQVRLVYEQLPGGLLATLVSIGICLFLLSGHIATGWLAVWTFFSLGIVAARFALHLGFKQSGLNSKPVSAWELRYQWSTVGVALIFGSAAFFLNSLDSPALRIFLVFFIGGTTAGALATHSALLTSYRIYAFVATLPTICALLILGGEVNNGIAALLSVFMVIIFRAAKFVHTGINRSLMLGFKNSELVESLSAANSRAHKINQALQREVREKKEQAQYQIEREERLREQQETLLNIIRYDSEQLEDLAALLQHTLETSLQVVRATSAIVWLLDSERNCLQGIGYFPPENFSDGSLRLDRTNFPEFFRMMEQEILVVIDDLGAEESIREVTTFCFRTTAVRSLLGAAIRAGGTPLGILCFFREEEPCRWSLEEQNFASTVAEIIAHAIDQHKRIEVEEALFESKERAQVTLESIGDGVITTDLAGMIGYLNPVAERHTGWSLAEARGKHIETVFKLIHESSGSFIKNVLESFLDPVTSALYANGVMLYDRSGQYEFAVEVTASPIRARNGMEIGRVIVFHDITELRVMTRRISYQASHDALTGLVNRREFENQLGLALYSARVEQKNHALLYMDLDQFKVVNDTCGHLAGDELLKQVANRFLETLRETDTLARIGGDEFGVLLRGCKLADAAMVAEKLCQEMRDFRFTWQDRVFTVSVSIGIAPIRAEISDMADLMSAADAACFMAKDAGRSRVHVYLPEDKEMAQWHGEMQWVHRINRALLEERLLLFYQPVMPISMTGAPWYCEFLLRMRDEHNDLVSPMAFIPAAERYQLMTALDRWVFETVVAASEAGHPVLEKYDIYAINISGQSLCDDQFLGFVLERFANSGAQPEKFCFEITETAAVSNFRNAAVFIEKVRSIGCSLALDDFGSGLSSFGYLKGLDVDFLKIDGSFVKDMVDNPIDRAMVGSINQIGQVMHKKTIAEFVENEAILAQLKAMGVDYAQGYGIDKPKPL